MKNKKNIISVLRQIYGFRCKSKIVAASIIATIVTIGNPSELTSAVRDGLYEAFGGTYS